MTILEWLVENMTNLRNAGVDSPRRDCLVLLEDTLAKDRTWVITHPDHSLTDPQVNKLGQLIKRRIKREPLAYIRGKVWFYGRFFKVTRNVLIPRPESEMFIEQLKNLASSGEINPNELQIVDIGTGSGCLAITSKLEFPASKVIATDIDKKTLTVARINSTTHKTDVAFFATDLLTSFDKQIFKQFRSYKNIIFITNLPYVPDNLVTSPEILKEPKQAIFSGIDGLNHYQRFWKEIISLSTYPQRIMTEALVEQHDVMEVLADQVGYQLEVTNGLIQCFKFKK